MKNKRPILGLITLLLLLGCQQEGEKQIKSDSSKEISVMLLGVYHFNNPGQDTYNMEIDDYYSDRRQDEIREIVGLLEEYNPTKVFVEFTPDHQSQIDSLYQLYLNDKIKLDEIKGGVNEAYQIGFRLGKQSGGIQIKAIDVVFAVILALVLNGWRESSDINANLEKVKESIRNEVKSNDTFLRESFDYRKGLFSQPEINRPFTAIHRITLD